MSDFAHRVAGLNLFEGLGKNPQTPIQRHIKVRGNKSPYDGDWVYLATRRGRQPGLPKRVATLLKWQAGKCAYCGLYFGAEDKSEVDHIISKARGGHDGYNNWQLLHAHCHHQKTVKDEKLKQLAACRRRYVSPNKNDFGVNFGYGKKIQNC
ncbi:MAG: HNH endonuclease [Chloroflexi bacterium]|nr:HNH endonuclease [Chloroflexota bacterium]